LVLVGAGIGYKMTHKTATPTSTNTTAATTTTESTAAESTETPDSTESTTSTATITYSNSGFSPETITVKTGDTVTIKNTSSRTVEFDSDPHPAHTTNTELNVNKVAAGQSETFKVVRTGTFGYHNHLNASETGTIIVQ
jgi:plastocyanin